MKEFHTIEFGLPDTTLSKRAEAIIVDWPAPKNIKAFFTLRNGGVSNGPYGSKNGSGGLNLGTHVGDDLKAVETNRRLASQLGCRDIKWLNQIHSTKVVKADDIKESIPDADACWTESTGIGCVIMTADCLPVFLCSKDGKFIAAAHAGWKGLVDGVLQTTVNELRKQSGEETEFIAWLGPRIGEKAFVVQDDVRQRYLASPLREGVAKYIIPGPQGFLLNLAGFAKLALAQVGVNEVFDCGLSTYENDSLFYSYRRDGITGRHAALIFKNS